MSDNITSQEAGANPTPEANPATNTAAATEQVNTQPSTEQAKAEPAQPAGTSTEGEPAELPSLPEKFTYQGKEYTPEQFETMVKTQQAEETRQAEAQKNAYQPREMAVIDADITKTTQSLEADAALLLKNYLAKAQDAVNINEAGEQVTQYTAQQAYEHGLQTGQWDYFISCLSPQDAIAFQKDRTKLAQDYSGKFDYLKQEKQYIEQTEAKKADVQKWDSYIEANKDKLQAGDKALLNKLKNRFGFDENGTTEFFQWLAERDALNANIAQLEEGNDAAKSAMINAGMGGGKPQPKQRIFKTSEIGKMSSAEFAKNEKEIDRQRMAGTLIVDT